MIRSRFFFQFCVFLVFANSTYFSLAAVISRDWQTPGDGLLTLDTVNKREWLDFSQTRLNQFPGASLEARYQNFLPELAPGGQFAGFTVAKSDDVIELAESGGVVVTTDDFDTNQAAVHQFIDLFGLALPKSFGRIVNFAFIDELLNRPAPYGPRRAVGFNFDPPTQFSNGGASLFSGGSSDFISAPSEIGVAIYRNIPEPTGLAMAIVGFLSSALSGRWLGRRKTRRPSKQQSRSLPCELRMEPLEDRAMLAVMADVVFLADESGSVAGDEVRSWIQQIAPALQAQFNAPGVDIDARYGLVGFGEGDRPIESDFDHGHSQLINGTLFTSVGAVSQLVPAVQQLEEDRLNSRWSTWSRWSTCHKLFPDLTTMGRWRLTLSPHSLLKILGFLSKGPSPFFKNIEF